MKIGKKKKNQKVLISFSKDTNHFILEVLNSIHV